MITLPYSAWVATSVSPLFVVQLPPNLTSDDGTLRKKSLKNFVDVITMR